MDEILDRIKALKIKRKYLILGLITSEILGILVLIWFLRIPLSQKFFITDPKAYSVTSMNPKKQYLIKQGDYLTGKAIPNTKIAILLTPSNKKAFVQTTDKGSWYYQIPEDLDTKRYHFSIVNLDKNNQIAFLKTYRFRVTTNSRLNQFIDSFGKKVISPIKKAFPNVFAQTEEDFQIEFGENFSNWAQGLQSLGYYVYCEKDGVDSPCEDGAEVFLTNYDGILSYCNFLSKQCLLNRRPDRDIVASAQDSSQEFIYRLLEKVDENNYNVSVLLDYFPELASSDDYETFRKQQRKGGSYKNDISEPELASLIQQVVNDLGWSYIWWDENFGDPVKTLISLSDPILGTRAIVDYLEAGSFNKLTYEQRNNLILAMAFLPIPLKGGGLISRTGKAAASEVGAIIQTTVKNGDSLPFSALRFYLQPGKTIPALEEQAGRTAWNNLRYTDLQAGSLPIPKIYPEEADTFWYALRNFVPKNLVISLQPDYTRNIMDRVINAYRTLAKNGVIESIPMHMRGVYETIDNQWVVGVSDNIWYVMGSDGQAMTSGRAVFVKWSSLTAPDAEYVLAHEFVHVIAYRIQGRPFVKGKHFQYDRGTPDEYSRFMSFIYEIATDDLAVFATGANSAYRSRYPELYDAAHTLVSYMSQKTNNSFSWNDLRSFALTADDGLLMRKIIGKEDPEAFMRFVKQYVDISKLMEVTEYKDVPLLANSVVDKNQLALLGYTGIASSFDETGNQILTTPPLYKNDGNILKDSTSLSNIQIISSFLDSQAVNITTIISQNGDPVDNSQLITKWYLEDINQNRTFLEERSETCNSGCVFSLPQELTAGEYRLIVELYSPNSSDPLSTDYSHLNLTAEPQYSQGDSTASLAVCEYEEWETEYECKNGLACYNLFYSSNQTSCQPQSRIVDEKHYRCVEEERCRDMLEEPLLTNDTPQQTDGEPTPPQYGPVPVDGVE